MKKIFTTILVLIMTFSIVVPVSAATNDGTGNTTIDVNAIYAGSVSTPDVVSVDIAWGEMQFTYHVSGTHQWNPIEHKYEEQTTASWTSSGNTVTVTNHSNVAVKAELSFTAESAYSGIAGSFGEDATLLLATAVGTDKNAAPVDTADLTLSGVLASDVTAVTKVGTITVKISKQ